MCGFVKRAIVAGMKIINVTDLTADLSGLLLKVSHTGESILVTRHGSPIVTIQRPTQDDIDEWKLRRQEAKKITYMPRVR